VGHWEGNTAIGAGHKQAIVTLVERKSGFSVLSHVTRKTSNLVSQAITTSLAPLAEDVKTQYLTTMDKSLRIMLLWMRH